MLGLRPSDLDAVLSIVGQIPSDQPAAHRRREPEGGERWQLQVGRMSASIATPAASRPGPMYPGRSLVNINNDGQIVGFSVSDPAAATARGFLWPGASTDPSPRSGSPARPPPWRSASTKPA
jgi:hypothetical protein